MDHHLALQMEPSDEARQQFTAVANDAGFFENINLSNLEDLKNEVLFHYVVNLRRTQLDIIRSGFWEVQQLAEFLSTRKWLWDHVFPRGPPEYTCSLVKFWIKYVPSGNDNCNRIRSYVENYIDTLG